MTLLGADPNWRGPFEKGKPQRTSTDQVPDPSAPNYRLVNKFAYKLSSRLSCWNAPGRPLGRRLQKVSFLYKILLKYARFHSFVWGGPSDKPAYSVLLCGCAVPCVRRWLFTWTALLRVCACVLHWNVQHMRVGNVRVQHQESFTGWVRMEQARVS